MANWFEDEENALVEQVNSGKITQKEFDREMRSMRDAIRAEAEEEAQAAYDRIMGNY